MNGVLKSSKRSNPWVNPIFTPVLSMFCVSFAALLCLLASTGLRSGFDKDEDTPFYKQKITYDAGKGGNDEVCEISVENEGYRRLQAFDTAQCLVEFTIPVDILLSNELYLYVQIDNFFQNHRKYIESRSISQLAGDEMTLGRPFDVLEARYDGDCTEEALISYTDNEEKLFFPCGLIAQSFFNDGIHLHSFTNRNHNLTWINSIPLSVSSDIEVSTSSEFEDTVNTEYVNPSRLVSYPQYHIFEYLWQTYDQFSCYARADASVRTPCKKWKDVALEQQVDLESDVFVKGSGCAACRNKDDHFVNEGGIPPPSDFSEGESDNGFRYPHFVQWMKNAAFVDFMKPLAKVKFSYLEGFFANHSAFELDELKYGFRKGDKLAIRIIPNFLVATYGGTKALVLSTQPPLKTRTHALAQAFLMIASISFSLSFLIFLKLKIKPRNLGDPTLT